MGTTVHFKIFMRLTYKDVDKRSPDYKVQVSDISQQAHEKDASINSYDDELL